LFYRGRFGCLEWCHHSNYHFMTEYVWSNCMTPSNGPSEKHDKCGPNVSRLLNLKDILVILIKQSKRTQMTERQWTIHKAQICLSLLSRLTISKYPDLESLLNEWILWQLFERFLTIAQSLDRHHHRQFDSHIPRTIDIAAHFTKYSGFTIVCPVDGCSSLCVSGCRWKDEHISLDDSPLRT
jgi:hypothetical protein